MVDILNGICSSIFLDVILLICDILKKIVFLKKFQRTDISVEIWILTEMNRQFWSCEAGADCPLVPCILPFLLSVERSSRDIKHLPRHYNVFSQHPPIYTIVSLIWPEDWEGTVFRSNKYFILCLWTFPCTWIFIKSLGYPRLRLKRSFSSTGNLDGASDPVTLEQISFHRFYHFQLLISALFQTVNFRHSQAFIWKYTSYQAITKPIWLPPLMLSQPKR